MSEALKIFAEAAPGAPLRMRVFQYLSSEAGAPLLARLIELEGALNRCVGEAVARAAAEIATELDRTQADLARAHALASQAIGERNANLRQADGAADYEEELAVLDPASRAIYRESIESALAGKPNPFPPELSGGTAIDGV